MEDGNLRPFADKRTHPSQFHRDASVVCRRLRLYPFAQIHRVPNAVDLFPAGNECSDAFQKTQVEVLIRVDVGVSQDIQRNNRFGGERAQIAHIGDGTSWGLWCNVKSS